MLESAGEASAEVGDAWLTLLAGLVFSFSKIFCDCAFDALMMNIRMDVPAREC